MLKTYTIKEVSKKINVPLGTIKKWEKEFSDFLIIPRSKGGTRLYSDTEIDFLLQIKEMRSQNMNIETIQDIINQQSGSFEVAEPTMEIVTEQFELATPASDSSQINMETFFNAMETYKQTVIQEVKEEIRGVVRKEIVEEMKKEISKGTLQTVKNLSDSIYKSTEKTKAEIQELASVVQNASEQTKENTVTLVEEIANTAKQTSGELSLLSNSINQVRKETAKEISFLEKTVNTVSKGTSNQISTMSKQLSKTSDDLAHYLEVTKNDICELTEALAEDRQNHLKEREEYRHEITQREAAFQSMLSGFRDAAATKEKKWWQFW